MNKKQLILLCMLAAGGSIQAQQWPDAPAEARPAPDGGGWEALSMKRT